MKQSNAISNAFLVIAAAMFALSAAAARADEKVICGDDDVKKITAGTKAIFKRQVDFAKETRFGSLGAGGGGGNYLASPVN